MKWSIIFDKVINCFLLLIIMNYYFERLKTRKLMILRMVWIFTLILAFLANLHISWKFSTLVYQTLTWHCYHKYTKNLCSSKQKNWINLTRMFQWHNHLKILLNFFLSLPNGMVSYKKKINFPLPELQLNSMIWCLLPSSQNTKMKSNP